MLEKLQCLRDKMCRSGVAAIFQRELFASRR